MNEFGFRAHQADAEIRRLRFEVKRLMDAWLLRDRQARRFYRVLRGRIDALRMAYRHYSAIDARKLAEAQGELESQGRLLDIARHERDVARLDLDSALRTIRDMRNEVQKGMLREQLGEAER